jgi:dipeptidyl-peptidase-4
VVSALRDPAARVRAGGLRLALGTAVAAAAVAATMPAARAAATAPGAPPAFADTAFLTQFAATNRLRFGDPTKITPTPRGDAVLFLRAASGRSGDQELWSFDVAAGAERRIASVSELLAGAEERVTAGEQARRERQRITARGITSFELSEDGGTVLIPVSGRVFRFDRGSGRTREVPTAQAAPAENPRLAPDGSMVACVRDGDLWVTDIASGAERRLTTRGDDDVTWGLPEFVAQEEMGRQDGFWWAPDSKRLLVQRTDASAVERLYISDPARPEATPQAWVYPRAGTANAEVRLFVIDAATGSAREARWDRARYPYLCIARWDASAPPTLVVMNRRQTELAVLAVNAGSGDTRVLHVERDAAWLNLDPTVPRWVEGGQAWLWTTERSGGWQLELRSRTGARIRTVAGARLGYRKLLAVDEPRGVVWLQASDEPTEQHVWRVPIRPGRGGTAERLTAAGGFHSGAFGSGDREVWVEARERPDGAREWVVRRGDGGELGRIGSRAEAPLVTPRPELHRVGPRGLRALVVRPADVRAGARYPVIVDVYGGPHHQDVTVQPRRSALRQWLANQGFIVVSVDGRGTPNRGRAWERAIRGDFLNPALDDQIEGLRRVAAQVPEMDLERVGITGWSFGGTMTCLAVAARPDVFRCGVAGAPVVDWRDYDTFYTERYLGLPGTDGEAYRVSSPLSHALRLERPLLLVHGTADDNVYFFNSLKLVEALTVAGRSAEFLPLIGRTHLVRDPVGIRRVEERTVEFFRRHLGGPR